VKVVSYQSNAIKLTVECVGLHIFKLNKYFSNIFALTRMLLSHSQHHIHKPLASFQSALVFNAKGFSS